MPFLPPNQQRQSTEGIFGLQKMLDICYNYGVTWDILFNPVKSHLITFGGSTPKASLQLNNDTLGWSFKVKYLGLYLTSGANFKIDLSTAKRKYFGCFYNIKYVIGQQVNEMMVLKLVKLIVCHVFRMAELAH